MSSLKLYKSLTESSESKIFRDRTKKWLENVLEQEINKIFKTDNDEPEFEPPSSDSDEYDYGFDFDREGLEPTPSVSTENYLKFTTAENGISTTEYDIGMFSTVSHKPKVTVSEFETKILPDSDGTRQYPLIRFTVKSKVRRKYNEKLASCF